MGKRRQAARDARRDQIIEGALETFASRGFAAATNRDIAEAAGINSPGLIYHYFASKEDLLRAVIERHAPPLQLLDRAEALMGLPPEEALREFARAYLRLLDDPKAGACRRVLIGEALRSQEFANTLMEVGPLRFVHLLSRYMSGKMDEGALRRADPTIAAYCFLGPLATYMLAQTILHAPEAMAVDTSDLVATSVRVFLGGLGGP